VALARDGQRLIAYVADKDRSRLAVVDVTAGAMQAAIPLFGAPEQVVILADGRVVTSIGSGRHIEVFEPTADRSTPLQRLCAREVPAGPFGLAVSPDERTLVVTSAWEPALTSFDMALAPRGRTPLARAPRGVLVDARNRAFVTHLAGSALSAVSLDGAQAAPLAISLGVRAGSPAGKEADLRVLRKGSQAYSLASVNLPPRRMRGEDTEPAEPRVIIVIPMVSVDPGDEERPTEFYYGPPPIAGIPKAAPVAIVVDPEQRQSLSTHVVATTGGLRAGACNLPRAVAAHGERLYVACEGIDELLELDARSADPMRTVRRRFQVPGGPTGVAVAAAEGLAVVYGQFDEALALVPLDGRKGTTIPIEGGTSSLSRAARRGRALFYRSDDIRIARDGMACSSCHPDGAEDGLTWRTPDGPRQTIMLARQLSGTAPFGWTRKEPTLAGYIADTCRRLGGHGLSSGDLDDLVTFLEELPRPPGARSSRPDLVAQGRTVFHDRGCATCHLGASGTDGQAHTLDRWEKVAIDTPSLRAVGRTAPYFHDGRYATLDDLLGDDYSSMGKVASLSVAERQALKLFLESL
jgi:hypothetical protein